MSATAQKRSGRPLPDRVSDMLRIYEPLYRPDQTQQEPLFVPLEIRTNDIAWREFRIYVDMYRQQLHRGIGHCGLFSPKFSLKSKIQTKEFLDFCELHADADVCFFNPFPQVRYVAFNVWNQGEPWHPGLAVAAQGLLDAAGIGWQIAQVPRQSSAHLSYSNFWVANERFWDAYVGGILVPIADFLDHHEGHPVTRSVLESTYHTDEASYLPFIIERLFSTFLSMRPDIRSEAYPIGDVLPYCICPSEQDLVLQLKPAVDAADGTGEYPEDLLESLRQAAWSNTRLAKLHFQTHPHPHSGKTIPIDAENAS
jgi:hypothetical protein